MVENLSGAPSKACVRAIGYVNETDVPRRLARLVRAAAGSIGKIRKTKTDLGKRLQKSMAASTASLSSNSTSARSRV